MKNEKRSVGFTLIELVVVIAIVGILMAVAIPKYVDMRSSAAKAADDEYAAGLRTAATMIMATNAIAGSTNAFGTFWPSWTDVTNQMQRPYTLQSYGSVWYDPTNGTIELQP